MRNPVRTLLPAFVATWSCVASPWSIADTSPMPDTMLAVASVGGSEVFSIHRMPVPKPQAGEVLIAVHATGVNAWEQQHVGEEAHSPVVLGSDGSTSSPGTRSRHACFLFGPSRSLRRSDRDISNFRLEHDGRA